MQTLIRVPSSLSLLPNARTACQILDALADAIETNLPTSFTIGSLGGQHASLRGGHVPRTFRGVKLANLRGVAGVGDRRERCGPVSRQLRQLASAADTGCWLLQEAGSMWDFWMLLWYSTSPLCQT